MLTRLINKCLLKLGMLTIHHFPNLSAKLLILYIARDQETGETPYEHELPDLGNGMRDYMQQLAIYDPAHSYDLSTLIRGSTTKTNFAHTKFNKPNSRTDLVKINLAPEIVPYKRTTITYENGDCVTIERKAVKCG